MNGPEQNLVDNVSKRVNLWAETKPFYPDSAKAPNRAAESRSTEAVLNALVLSASGHALTLPAALRNMWAAQLPDGGFAWIDFHNRPWEADDSRYYGSALAAVAVGKSTTGPKENVAALVRYLNTGYQSQSVANKLVALWARANLPQLLTETDKSTLLKDLATAQNADGGWSLSSLAGPWKRADGTALETGSDGYATGLAVYAMAEAGVPKTDKSLAGGLRWLAANQSAADGHWVGYSLNKNRDLNSDVGRFMSDAATAFAVLALTLVTLDRRLFLLAAAAAPLYSGPLITFTDSEKELVDAIAETIIPADDSPGASAAGVVFYIDKQLAGPLKRFRPAYSSGLPLWNSVCRKQTERSFLVLDSRGRTAFLQEAELKQDWKLASFLQLVIEHTMQGFYGSPEHGGNQGEASWKMLGIQQVMRGGHGH